VKCPLCSGEIFEEVEKYLDFTLFHCGQCDAMWWEPLKMPSHEFYENLLLLRDVYSFADELEYDHKQFLENPPIQGGDLLDIGCGTGRYLADAKKLNFDVTGIDFDRQAIETAKTKYGIEKAYAISFEDYMINYPENKFDVITCFQILEHVEDPALFIDQTKSRLKPGGYIVISTPNRERWVGPHRMPHYKSGARGDYPPIHLTRWSEKAMVRFLSGKGFKEIEIRISPLSLSEAREYLTRKIPYIYKMQSSIASSLMNNKILTDKKNKSKVAILSKILGMLAGLRKMLLMVPSLPIFYYGRTIKKQGCFLYVTGRLP
jgi:SAM-dependent methyltransferase